MKYLYLELNQYKRFALNQIEHFSIVVNNPLQVILGLNGSGKSSLMSQFTPLPANSADFAKTGSKIIKISHRNAVYTLKSTFIPSQKHSFCVGDEELNQGGTITIQRELVKEHFGITHEIHGLMLGEERFTDMSTSRRKEWFIRLCETNYDYAINVYTKAQVRHRDVVGALKIAKKKLIHESEKLIKTDEETKITNEALALHEQLNLMLEYRKPIETDVAQLQIQQSTIDSQLKKFVNTLNFNLDSVGSERGLSDEKLNSIVTRFNGLIIANQSLIATHSKEYDANQSKITILQKAEEQTIDSLEQRIKSNLKNQSALIDKLIHTEHIDAETAMNSFLSVKPTLIDIFSNIPVNDSKKYSSENLATARATLNEYNLRKADLITNLQSAMGKQKHMLDHKDKSDITCTNCNHRFSLHYSEESLLEIEQTISRIEKTIEEKLKDVISEKEKYIEECGQYSIQYRQYVNTVNSFRILRPYWDYLDEKNTITHNPFNGVNELAVIENDLKLQITFSTLVKEYDEMVALKTSLMDVGGSDLNTLLLANKSLQCSIDELTDTLVQHSNVKNKYSAILLRNKEMRNLYTKINELIVNKETLLKEEIETTRRTIFNDLIRVTQTQLATKENILATIKSQKNIILNLQVNLIELEAEEIALAHLVKQLSPVEGLIAEGLIGFIKTFLNQMNHVIKKIWTYPLTILPCEIEDDNSIDLNYKFKLKVDNKGEPVADVKFGSNAMLEVINLAFKIVSAKFLKQHTLYLDEVGVAMDNQHKTELFKQIHDLVEHQSFSQVFIISHEFSHYGAFNNAEICVLNKSNIIVPKAYNEHVTMN